MMSLTDSLRSYETPHLDFPATRKAQQAILPLVLNLQDRYPHLKDIEPHHTWTLVEDFHERQRHYTDLTDGHEEAVQL